MERYLYRELAGLIDARHTCIERGNKEWQDNHTQEILSLVKNHMPSGSGFDNGTKIDLDRSHADKLIFHTSFHHMNDTGYYCGWTDHTVTVTPSLYLTFNLRVSGRNVNDIKEYIDEAFRHALMTSLQVTIGA